MKAELTGRFFHKTNLFGNLVLYVEEKVKWSDTMYNEEGTFLRWRKAENADLIDLNMY
jgi:hypothetical protein